MTGDTSNAAADFNDTTLGLLVGGTFAWAAGDVVTPPAGTTLNLNRQNGLFSGSFYNPKTKVQESFGGAMLQRSNYGAGLFTSSAGLGAVRIVPKQ